MIAWYAQIPAPHPRVNDRNNRSPAQHGGFEQANCFRDRYKTSIELACRKYDLHDRFIFSIRNIRPLPRNDFPVTWHVPINLGPSLDFLAGEACIAVAVRVQ